MRAAAQTKTQKKKKYICRETNWLANPMKLFACQPNIDCQIDIYIYVCIHIARDAVVYIFI